jgi:hypothetical protein
MPDGEVTPTFRREFQQSSSGRMLGVISGPIYTHHNATKDHRTYTVSNEIKSKPVKGTNLNFCLQQAMKARGRSRGIALLFI